MEGKGGLIAVCGGASGGSPIKKIVEVLDEKRNKVGETDLTLKNPTKKEIKEAKSQASFEKYQREQRMRVKIRAANIQRINKKELKKKNKRKMIKKSRKRNRKK